MTQFWVRITIWSSLHEPIWISRWSHRSVFESPMYRVHNEHKSGSLLPGLDRTSDSNRYNTQTNIHREGQEYMERKIYKATHLRTNLHIHAQHTDTLMHNTHVHTSTHIYNHAHNINTISYWHNFTHILKHIAHTCMHAYTLYTHTTPYIYIHMHSHKLIHS